MILIAAYAELLIAELLKILTQIRKIYFFICSVFIRRLWGKLRGNLICKITGAEATFVLATTLRVNLR